MPRRIPDYPDAFAGWNAISSFGSVMFLLSEFLFLIVILKLFYSKRSFGGSWRLSGAVKKTNSLDWFLDQLEKTYDV